MGAVFSQDLKMENQNKKSKVEESSKDKVVGNLWEELVATWKKSAPSKNTTIGKEFIAIVIPLNHFSHILLCACENIKGFTDHWKFLEIR
jgi:hypothetical protein